MVVIGFEFSGCFYNVFHFSRIIQFVSSSHLGLEGILRHKFVNFNILFFILQPRPFFRVNYSFSVICYIFNFVCATDWVQKVEVWLLGVFIRNINIFDWFIIQLMRLLLSVFQDWFVKIHLVKWVRIRLHYTVLVWESAEHLLV